MPELTATPLAHLTTVRLGGPARRLVEATGEDEVVAETAAADAAGAPLLAMSGGSNLVVADEGFDGTVVRVATRGVEVSPRDGLVGLRVAAGEPWDGLVARCVAEGLAGIECLSGIPGSVGATPIQNVGAYGQEISETMVSLRAYDRASREVVEIPAERCGFGYRTSSFRHSDRHVVLDVTFALERSGLGRPLGHEPLAAALGADLGARAPLDQVREAVLGLRRQKAMVVDPRDPDSVSTGSFFLNPVLPADRFAALERAVAARLGDGTTPPGWAAPGGRIKTSAAWLIERAGFGRGYGPGRVTTSSKHVLALVNRGGASTAELVALARELRDGVRDAFGIALEPEPTLVGVALERAG